MRDYLRAATHRVLRHLKASASRRGVGVVAGFSGVGSGCGAVGSPVCSGFAEEDSPGPSGGAAVDATNLTDRPAAVASVAVAGLVLAEETTPELRTQTISSASFSIQ